MPGTALAWHEVLVHSRRFEPARDRQRFREAFRTLASRQRRWPAPVDFLDALPRIEPERSEAPKLDDDASRAVGLQHISAIASKLRIRTEDDYGTAA